MIFKQSRDLGLERGLEFWNKLKSLKLSNIAMEPISAENLLYLKVSLKLYFPVNERIILNVQIAIPI